MHECVSGRGLEGMGGATCVRCPQVADDLSGRPDRVARQRRQDGLGCGSRSQPGPDRHDSRGDEVVGIGRVTAGQRQIAKACGHGEQAGRHRSADASACGQPGARRNGDGQRDGPSGE